MPACHTSAYTQTGTKNSKALEPTPAPVVVPLQVPSIDTFTVLDASWAQEPSQPQRHVALTAPVNTWAQTKGKWSKDSDSGKFYYAYIILVNDQHVFIVKN